MNTRTREFLDMYNRLEHLIRDAYDVPSNRGAIAWLVSNDRSFRSMRDELNYIREVRNFLQHNELVCDDYAVTPTEGMLKSLRRTVSKIENIPCAETLCVKAQDVYSAGMGDLIRPAMREMAQKSYTHVPILEDGRVRGVFSENTLLSCMNSDEVVEISEKDTFEKVRDLLPLDNHVSEEFVFVDKDIIAPSIAELFQKALARRSRIGMVFVTANGKQSERLLGILTAWDLAKYF